MQLIGYESIVDKLKHGLPSSLLLIGIPGIGKSHLAEVLAFNTGQPQCNIISVEEDIGVGVIKELVQHLSVCPFSGYKVAIVNTDAMTSEAFQALLKVLEEPPSWVKFILYGSNIVPLTIRSRCQVINLPPLTEDQVAKVLIQQSMLPTIAKSLATRSRGSVSYALGLLSQEVQLDKVKSFIQYAISGDLSLIIKVSMKWDETLDRILYVYFTELAMYKVSVPIVEFKPEDFCHLEQRLSMVQIEELIHLCTQYMRSSLRILVIALKLIRFCRG